MAQVISKLPSVERSLSELLHQSRTLAHVANIAAAVSETPTQAATATAAAASAAASVAIAVAGASEYGHDAGRRMDTDGLWWDDGWRQGPIESGERK